MPDAVFKDLCVDVADAVGLAASFYAPALGLTVAPERSQRLDGAEPEHTVWVNAVPEPHTVKNRVHLDLHCGSIEELEALGATVLQRYERWTTMADPEGNEICGFVRAEPPAYRLYELVVDCVDPASTCRWWADRFGIEAQQEGDGTEWWLGPGGPSALPWEVVFDAVPEPKTVKNRVHWDVWGDTAVLVAAGATLLRARDDEIGWDMLADPEGNEFCVFART